MKKLFLFLCLLFLLPTAALCRDKTYTIQSPDCSLTVTIGCGDRIVYSVRSDTNQILKPSPLALRLVSGECWGRRSRVAGVRRYRIDEVYDAPVYKKRKVEDRCNGIVIDFREGFSLEFRASYSVSSFLIIFKIRITHFSGPFHAQKKRRIDTIRSNFFAFRTFLLQARTKR